MTYTTDAFVLDYKNQGERDRLYHLFTEKHGKIDALAKGGQKILSKLAPHLEPPALARVLIAKGRFGDKLAGSQIKKTYPSIRKNFLKREILFFCFKIVILSTRPEGADEGVYKFLEEFMDILEKSPDAINKENRISIIISFLLRFFSLIGFHPNFDESNLSKESVENWVSGILDKAVKIG
jgi:DNA repair protein RecO